MRKNKLVAPVLKWVGGKRQLLDTFRPLLPKKITTYCEPFVGGGALLFHLQPNTAYINDINPELIRVYTVIKENVDELIDTIYKYLPYGPMFYDEDTITDQPMRQIVAELIREKALHALNEEIPHGIAVVIDSMKERKSQKGIITDIQATIICERDSHKGIIIGKGGEMLKKIGANAR